MLAGNGVQVERYRSIASQFRYNARLPHQDTAKENRRTI